MGSTKKVKVNNQFEFDLTEKDIANIDAVHISDTQYHILEDNISYHTEIVTSDFDKKQYTIKVNNVNYHVDIADALDMQIAAMGFTIGSAKQVNAIKAPMPGLLLDIHVKEGQEVQEDDPLLILEAMKMENVIVSPREGIIKSVAVSQGDAVDKGQLLIEFE